MALELHSEQSIGYKPLSDADLGRSKKSGQTHIGLCQRVFTFLPNEYNNDCMFQYENSIERLPFYFDRILRQDGTYDSPKTRIGNEYENTIARKIREITATQPETTKWYLIWFGLKDEQLVFILLNEQSQIFKDMTAAKIIFPTRASALTAKSPRFASFLQILEKHVADKGIIPTEELHATKDLETAAQTSHIMPEELPAFDINKARENWKEVGRKGEIEINKYFEGCKTRGEFLNYTWVNAEKESGKPYDFILVTSTNETIHLDVKTTDYGFNEPMHFSSQEIAFAISPEYKNSEYHVYRVYKNDASELCLRICTNIRKVFDYIHFHTRSYEPAINIVAKIETIKFSLLPEQNDLNFGEEIKLE